MRREESQFFTLCESLQLSIDQLFESKNIIVSDVEKHRLQTIVLQEKIAQLEAHQTQVVKTNIELQLDIERMKKQKESFDSMKFSMGKDLEIAYK